MYHRYIFLLSFIFSALTSCQIHKSLKKGYTFSYEQFCDLKNTNEKLDCLEYIEEKTAVIITIDEEGMRFIAVIEDKDIQASLTTRDTALYKESCFEIFFDPNADGKNYYEIEINPLGTIFDYILKDADGPLNTSENMVQWHIPQENLNIEVLGTINDDRDVDKGWGLELYIPWKLVYEGAPKKLKCISFNFMRIDADKGMEPRYWVVQTTGRKLIHVPETWPKVCF